MASSRKVLIGLVVILSFSTLSLSQTNGQKNKSNRDSKPALKPPTLPKSSVDMDSDSELGFESDSDPILPLELDIASKPSMPPGSGPKPHQKPGTQQKLTPQASPASASDPRITSHPKASMTPNRDPDSETELPTEPDGSESEPESESESEPESESDPILPLELDIASKPSMPPGSGPKPHQNPGTPQKLTPQASPASTSDPRTTTHPKASMAPNRDPDSETELPTEPDDDPAPSSKPKPSPSPSSKPKPAPPPSSKPKTSPEPSPVQKPATKQAPKPKQGSKSAPQPTPPTEKTPSTPTTKPTFPYQTVNNFCLYKRLNVNRIFCLKVLKNPKAANATATDYTPLLQVATKATACHVIKTLKYLKTLYKDKKTDPALKPSIRECVVAYQEVAEYIKLVIADASQESAIAGLDGEVIVEDINRCVRAVPKIKNNEVGERNQIAKNYAKLLGDIADNPGEPLGRCHRFDGIKELI